ncbi:esterase FE4-like [Trichoplusia ni]|uniref:Esterase FE4-like n=1 Tax=Trichoplusia ni TaxID=7111 RepID=A0A7E5WZE6_TRINI|nr:esterase FE4-like [Trichoplusia ni]
MKGILLCALILVSNVCGETRVDPLVLISSQGLVQGYKASDGDYAAFLGVPYAWVDPEDPFGPAQTRPAFEEIIYYARDSSIQCPQMTSTHTDSEVLDCLRLNIYVPHKASSSNPLPVLVWFHGGDFERGSGGQYGVRNLVRHDIVVITVNYRLGPYGFMCLDIPNMPGNQGLKDQYKALEWIRKNIASFGGNPYNVTISGQDAGATSVLLHLYADTDRYYHKAIVESGTPQSEGMFVNADTEVPVKLAAHLGYTASDTQDALQFLSKSPHELVTGAALELNLHLRPCKERSFSGIPIFVADDPYSLTNEKKVSKTPILIGYTSQERDSLSSDYFDSDPFYEKLKNNFNLNEQQLAEAAKIARRFYLGDKPVSKDVETQLGNFESDFVYNHPTERVITRLLEESASSIYEYLFSYVGDSGAAGAGHSAELNYLFTKGGNPQARSDEDQLIIDRITTLWTNFIKYGNPTPKVTDLLPVKWTPVDVETRPTLIIDTDMRLDNRVENQRMAFWDLFYSMYGSYSIITRECSFEPYCC